MENSRYSILRSLLLKCVVLCCSKKPYQRPSLDDLDIEDEEDDMPDLE
jgi:hypothetical protein